MLGARPVRQRGITQRGALFLLINFLGAQSLLLVFLPSLLPKALKHPRPVALADLFKLARFSGSDGDGVIDFIVPPRASR
jgi:hypothetical protein